MPDTGQPGSAADGQRNAAAGKLTAAREALAAARAQARARGLRPAGSERAEDTGSEPASGQPPGSARAGPPGTAAPGPPRAARRVRRDDPQALSTAIEGLLDAEGWNLAAATGSVFGRWAQIVGPDLAAHTRPESLRDGELAVTADSTAWATQLRLLAAQLIHRLNSELGDGTVRQVKVRGPVSAPRKPGEWRVRDSRGPRDTYG